MTDRSKDELLEFLNSQLHLPAADRDWTMTEGEMHLMIVGLKVVMLKANKIADDEERIKKTQHVFRWVMMMSEHCLGFEEHARNNMSKILADADEIFKKSEENIA